MRMLRIPVQKGKGAAPRTAALLIIGSNGFQIGDRVQREPRLRWGNRWFILLKWVIIELTLCFWIDFNSEPDDRVDILLPEK